MTTATDDTIPYGLDDLLDEVACAARPARPALAAQASVPASFVFSSSLHSVPPRAPPRTYAVSTGAHVSFERASTSIAG